MQLADTKVITGEVRFSYVHVWEPDSVNGDNPKYSVSILIRKDDKETLSKIQAAILAAKEAAKIRFGGKLPSTFKMPLRDGDTDREDDKSYEGCYFLNASSKTAPGIVDRQLRRITVQEEFYSGCYGRASIKFYAFDANGSKGIACGLDNLMKTRDGEPLGGRQTAENDFASFAEGDAQGIADFSNSSMDSFLG